MSSQSEDPTVSPLDPDAGEPESSRTAGPASPGSEEPETPAGFWSRLALVSTPFVLLVAFFLADRWIRG